ncbi:MAG: hypothetical protein A2V98_00730 [Planctomycetes bacterium RBG_16_64_12]|nr:MAG: hypothetical protein A2V98_00730 [Planctomycetes bacterium RBG_16_64_12]
MPLGDRATIVVVGGGPAGAFFAIRMLRRARQLNKDIDLIVVEKKRELQFYEASCLVPFREGCNYCAGGVSPRLADLLEEAGLTLPEDIVQGRVESLTVHGEWKSIELPIPAGRSMFSVFRGSRPAHRRARHVNFDSYLLEKAVAEGARVVTGEVRDVDYSPTGKPVVTYRAGLGPEKREEIIEADFVVLAAGVNQTPGAELETQPVFRILERLIPGFRPPKVRIALICELEADDRLLRLMQGELHFAEYGSKTLKIEMSSLIPKARCITVVLLGRSVDRAAPSKNVHIVREFLRLPHIKRLLARGVKFVPLCLCNPNMAVGVAKKPFGHRIALAGDMVVSRLYKDGILSAYLTASALADCILDVGVDEDSLRRGYRPVIRRFARDVAFGRVVFLLNRITFNNRLLSRILYQAALTERKGKPEHKCRLGSLLWRIASGDDSYGRILLSMFHPATLSSILIGGALVTARNYVTERVFGLAWGDFERHPTGIPKEVFEARRKELLDVVDHDAPQAAPEFESMYSIRIKADRQKIFRHLGRFGDDDREYFRPRMLKVHRTRGEANEVASVIQYDCALRFLSFSVVLEKVIPERYLIYRVRDGFARGGVLIFHIDTVREGLSLLSIYVGFDFPKGKTALEKLGWSLFKVAFPGFVHDVIWNHSLCQLKDVIESDEATT